jgi:hypothetical protein
LLMKSRKKHQKHFLLKEIGSCAQIFLIIQGSTISMCVCMCVCELYDSLID